MVPDPCLYPVPVCAQTDMIAFNLWNYNSGLDLLPQMQQVFAREVPGFLTTQSLRWNMLLEHQEHVLIQWI